jgi:hypothetical protein
MFAQPGVTQARLASAEAGQSELNPIVKSCAWKLMRADLDPGTGSLLKYLASSLRKGSVRHVLGLKLSSVVHRRSKAGSEEEKRS